MPYVPNAHGTAASSVFGALAAFIDDPQVTDVVLLGEMAWIDRGHGCEPQRIWLDEPVEQLARRLVEVGGRHVDEVTPIADVRIGAVRVHVVLPPVSPDGVALSLRVARPSQLGLAELVQAGTLTDAQAARLHEVAVQGQRVLISGGTGSGKTTLLRALLAVVPAHERLVTVEDTVELAVPHPHVVALEARQANIEGAGAIGLDQLVRAALRMRPDWLVLGECRGGEIASFLTALNTGHNGGGTVHANSLDDVPARLEGLGVLAGLPAEAVGRQAASAFDVVVHLERQGGVRRCRAMGRLRLQDGQLSVVGGEDVWGSLV